jgi:hypothetical protein
VDCSGRHEDSRGSSVQGETPQALAPRRLTGHPQESEVPETEINWCLKATKFKNSHNKLLAYLFPAKTVVLKMKSR